MDFEYVIPTGPNAKKTVGTVFLSKFTQGRPSECWLWAGKLFSNGYGAFQSLGKDYLAHRVSYEHSSGVIPPMLVVMHTCDDRKCVNPRHLRLGTQVDNMQDMIIKGRANPSRGEGSGKAKLTYRDVAMIRSSPLSQKELALILGVSQKQVSVVRRGIQWSHV